MSHDVVSLAAIVGFLVAMMVLARACADEGLFDAWGAVIARSSAPSSGRRLAFVVVLIAVVTAALTLDATVAVLAPVLLVTAGTARRATAMATIRVANTGSTLLPVSNITNLLAFTATGLSFVQFAWLMLPAWIVGVAAELAVVRWWFRRDVVVDPTADVAEAPVVPLFPAAVVVAVLLSLAGGAEPWVPAVAGAIILSIYALARGTTTRDDLLEAANIPLALLVLVWAIVVALVGGTRVADDVDRIIPSADGLLALLATALVGMVAAAAVNNMPATILLLPAAAAAGPVNVLALLVGVNAGANLSAIGSLANLQWRQSSPRDVTGWGAFHTIGLATTPVIVVFCATALWAWTGLVR
jgi:arsenical pump membrane protein